MSKLRRIGKSLTRRASRDLVRPFYNKFSIANTVGSVVRDQAWAVSPLAEVSIGNDQYGRTALEVRADSSGYFVCGGTDKDFAVLNGGAGIDVDPGGAIDVHSKIVVNGAKIQLLVLEFDGNRKRIGECVLDHTRSTRMQLSEQTHYILLAIRYSGSVRLTVEWLLVESAPGAAAGPRLTRLENPKSDYAARGESLRKNSQILRKKLTELETEIDALSSHSQVFGVAGAHPATHEKEPMVRDLLLQMGRSLPTSNGSYHYDRIPLKVGLITDEYMYNFYRDAFEHAIYLTPDTIEKDLAQGEFDALLYVTCWKGMDGEDWKGVKYREKPAAALEFALQFAKDHGIPTIFQSIEDPSNFEYFLPIAERFEWIFTSDSDSIPAYKEALGHERVFYGEYGANPIINNPIGSFRFNLQRAVFAGSYPERYPERCNDMNAILGSFERAEDSLVIFDRNYGSGKFEYPEEFQAATLGAIPHDDVQLVHKLFSYGLNFNSIKNSPTMCAMRVYELQAQGKPLISNYAKSVFNKFPEIQIVPEKTDLSSIFHGREHLIRTYLASRLMPHLFLEKSNFQLAGEMVAAAGLESAPSRPNRVLVLAREDALAEVSKIVDSQIGIDADLLDIDSISRVDFGKYGYVAFMDPSYDYDSLYLASRVSTFVFADVQFATQNLSVLDGEAEFHEFVNLAANPALTVARSDMEEFVGFARGETAELVGNGYLADPFRVLFKSRFAELSNDSLDAVRVSVIVPVYNNGRFLLSKCLPSLLAERCWSEMEIVLVDDGSDDSYTISLCETLASLFDNISFYSFADGGSGSASRPRNRGVQLANGKYVAFLDPDNEMSPGGYSVLLSEMDRLVSEGEVVDLISGYQVKVGDSVGYTGRHANGGTVTLDDPCEVMLANGKFPVVSTQAALIDIEFLRENDIQFVEGATGQDTLYGWELLAKAKKVAFTDVAHLIYYAQRSDSVTNVVSDSFFDRSYVLEEYQAAFLRREGLIDVYREKKLEPFLNGWYRPRVERLPEEQRSTGEQFLRNVKALYE